MASPGASAHPPPDVTLLGNRPRPNYRKALYLSLAVSAVVHVAAILYYPLMMGRLTPEIGTFIPVLAVPPQGPRLIQIREVAGGVEMPGEEEPEPGEEEPSTRPEDRPVPGFPGPATVEASPTEALTVAERMRPTEGDARLWRPLVYEVPALTEEQRAQLELEGRLEAWNDSVQAEMARAAAALDWTHTDDQGRRWGVSPGALHLGNITIPFPFAFGTPAGRRDEAIRRAWEWDEIERGAASGAVQESWRDRAEAIRRRRDAERAAQPKPDTSSIRR